MADKRTEKGKRRKNRWLKRLPSRMFRRVRYVKPFDIAIEEHKPHWYDDGFGAIYFDEDYYTAKSDEVRQEMAAKYIEFWNGFKKYLNARDITLFDNSIDNVNNLDFGSVAGEPNISVMIKGRNGYKVGLKLSSYDRLYAEIEIGKLPKFDEKRLAMDMDWIKGYLERYIRVWDNNDSRVISRGYGRNIHLWKRDGTLYFCTAFREHEEGGDITTDEARYRWLYKMTKIAMDIADERQYDFDTHSPAECKKYIEGLKLEGRTITRVCDIGWVSDKYEDDGIRIMLDGEFAVSLDDGRSVGFNFSAASHMRVNVMDDWDVFEIERPWRSKPKCSEILEELVGAKIAKVEVVTTRDSDDLGDAYWELDFDIDKHDEYIHKLVLTLDNGRELIIETAIDWTHLHLVSHKKS